MKYVWYCNWNKQASDWKDSHRCEARSRKVFDTRREAEDSGRQHELRDGHGGWTSVVGKDGRCFRGWNK